MHTHARTEEEALNGKPVFGALKSDGEYIGHVSKEDDLTLSDVANQFELDGVVRIKGKIDGSGFNYTVDLSDPEPEPEPRRRRRSSRAGDQAVEERVHALQMEIERLENERDLLEDKVEHHKKQAKKARQEADEQFERRRREKNELLDKIDELREELSKTKGDTSWGKELGQTLVEKGLPQVVAILQKMSQPERKQLQEGSTVDTPTTPQPQQNGHAPQMEQTTQADEEGGQEQTPELTSEQKRAIKQDVKSKIIATAAHTARGNMTVDQLQLGLEEEYSKVEKDWGYDVEADMDNGDWLDIAISLVRGVAGDVDGDRLAEVVYPVAQEWSMYLPLLQTMEKQEAARKLVDLAGIEDTTEEQIQLLADTLTGLQKVNSQSA